MAECVEVHKTLAQGQARRYYQEMAARKPCLLETAQRERLLDAPAHGL